MADPKRVDAANRGWETRRANGRAAMSDETKERIAEALSGRKLTKRHRARVARGVRRYWALREEA